VYWAENLPPGASFDPVAHALVWTPDYHSAGTYAVTFVVSDGLHQVRESTTLLIAPTPRPPVVLTPAPVIANEGEAISLPLQATSPDGLRLTYSSLLLPPGSSLDPATGVFTWVPAFYQHGGYAVPITVSDGKSSTTVTLNVNVLNVNAPPDFEDLGDVHV